MVRAPGPWLAALALALGAFLLYGLAVLGAVVWIAAIVAAAVTR
jgi:hypothetical protein